MTDTPSSPDIVAELDPWLRAERDVGFTKLGAMVQRARDEIVALRAREMALDAHVSKVMEIEDDRYQRARAEALDEAARLCERLVNRETWPEGYNPVHAPDPRTCGMLAAWMLKLKGDL